MGNEDSIRPRSEAEQATSGQSDLVCLSRQVVSWQNLTRPREGKTPDRASPTRVGSDSDRGWIEFSSLHASASRRSSGDGRRAVRGVYDVRRNEGVEAVADPRLRQDLAAV